MPRPIIVIETSLVAIELFLLTIYILMKLRHNQKFKGFVKSQWWLHPNAISVERTILMFLSWFLYFTADTRTGLFLAVFIFVFAALMDSLDGFIARNFALTTVEGKCLDPLLDKACSLPPLFYFAYCGNLRPGLVWILFFFDIAGQFMIRPLLNKWGYESSANVWGKIKTPAYFIVAVLCTIPASPHQIPMGINCLLTICAGMAFLSFIRKIPRAFWAIFAEGPAAIYAAIGMVISAKITFWE